MPKKSTITPEPHPVLRDIFRDILAALFGPAPSG